MALRRVMGRGSFPVAGKGPGSSPGPPVDPRYFISSILRTWLSGPASMR